jgi:hypothetical protein
MFNKIILFLCLCLPIASHAIDKPKGKTTGTDPIKEKPLVISASNSSNLSKEMQLALNKSMAQLEGRLANTENKQAIDKMLDVKEVVTLDDQAKRAQANQLFSYLDANQDHVSPIANFSLDQAKTLPIGAYTGNGNNKIMIGVLKATFTPTYVEATVFIRIQFEMNNTVRDLFFGAEGIKFTNKGLLPNNALKFSLLGDFIIPGEKWSIIFKGSTGAGGAASSKTFVEFNCGDFEKASLAVDVIFPTNVLLPYDIVKGIAIKDGTRVKFSLKEASFTKTDSGPNWLVGVDFGTNSSSTKLFCIPGMEKFGIEVTNVWYDNSNIGKTL